VTFKVNANQPRRRDGAKENAKKDISLLFPSRLPSRHRAFAALAGTIARR
jgi:hypothetical protein